MFRLAITFWMLLALCIPLQASDQASPGLFVFTGIPIAEASLSRHVRGQEVAVYEIVAAAHEMNLGGGHQPVDLRQFFNIIEDPASGHSAYCRAAFARVLLDRSSTLATATAVPYLEINVSLSQPEIASDEGDALYPASAVSCWEALDSRP
jgi:hypothetical protein